MLSDSSVVINVVTQTWDYNANISLWKMKSFEGAFRPHLQNWSDPVMKAVTTPETLVTFQEATWSHF
jgi:hypothetical protein